MTRYAIILMLGFAAAGCSSYAGPELPRTTAAQGKATLPGGQPLRAGRVVLNPQEPGGVEAFGDVKSDGTFTLTTYQSGDGAAPGRYVVTISPFDYRNKSGSPRRIAEPIPAKYLDAKTSDLQVEVLPGENTVSVNLRK